MISSAIFEQIAKRAQGGAFTINYWDSKTVTYGQGASLFTIWLKDPKVISEIVRKVDIGFGEAYMDGRLEITKGNWEDFYKFYFANSDLMTNHFKRVNYRWNHNRKGAQTEQIQAHYDVGNDFYKLWLDDTMTYTCAYFRTPKDSLETAQRQKLDHVLRKLQLQKGHEMVDIGCGWGYLLVRAAKNYGAKGIGVTLSREQYEFATELAKREGVSDRVEFKLMNYQDLLPTKKQYDRVVSVGLLEHVGRNNHRQYFDVVNGLLKPGGVSVVHSITKQDEKLSLPWFDKYIFPGAYVPSMREIVWLLPEYGFRTLDLENLRLHYAMTLDEWLRRFEAHLPEVQKMYDERFIRMWRLYLGGMSASFRYGKNELTQIVFSKGINNDLPLTREHIYK